MRRQDISGALVVSGSTAVERALLGDNGGNVMTAMAAARQRRRRDEGEGNGDSGGGAEAEAAVGT